MKSFIKISILVPAYNVEKYIRNFLDGLVNQTLRDIEIILVNDASPDSCHSIIQEYLCDDRIRYVKKQVNEGLWKARQTAYELATGEYIINLDPDDLIDINFLEELYLFGKQHNLDIVQSNVVTIDQNGRQLTKGIFKDLEKKVLKSHKDYNQILGTPYASWFRLVKKDLLIRFDYNYIHQRELIHFSYQFCDNVKVGINPLVSYYYRKHETSLSNYHKSSKRLRETNEFSWHNIQLKALEIKNLPIKTPYMRAILNTYVFRVYYTLIMISWLADNPPSDYRKQVRLYLADQFDFNLANYLKHVYWFKRSEQIFLTLALIRSEFLIRKILMIRLKNK